MGREKSRAGDECFLTNKRAANKIQRKKGNWGKSSEIGKLKEKSE